MNNLPTPRADGALLTARRGTRSASWRAHAALLCLVGGYIGMSATQTTPDANIGLGLGLLALSAMSAPWSVPLLMSDRMSVDSGLLVAVATGGAMVNLVIHAVIVGRRSARSMLPH